MLSGRGRFLLSTSRAFRFRYFSSWSSGETLKNLEQQKEELQKKLLIAEERLLRAEAEIDFFKDGYNRAQGPRAEKVVRDMLMLTHSDVEFYRGQIKDIQEQLERSDLLMFLHLQERRRRGVSSIHRDIESSSSWFSFFRKGEKVDSRDLSALQNLNGKNNTDIRTRRREPFPLCTNSTWELEDRYEPAGMVMKEWLKSFRTNQRGKSDSDMHSLVCVFAPRGYGCSRFLHMLGSAPESPGDRSLPAHLLPTLTDANVKYITLHDVVESGAINADFVERLEKAINIRVTFGFGMSRERDAAEFPSLEDALVMRVLFSWFGDHKKGYRDFIQQMNRQSLPSLEHALEMVRKDASQSSASPTASSSSPLSSSPSTPILSSSSGRKRDPQHIVLCIDEILRGSDGEDLAILVSALGELLDKDPNVSVVIASESVEDLSSICKNVGRPLAAIDLPALSIQGVDNLIEQYHKKKPWDAPRWLHDTFCVQLVRACGGNPSLMNTVFPLLEPGHSSLLDLVGHVVTQDTFSTHSEIFDPTSELATLALVSSLRGEVLESISSPDKRLESLGIAYQKGYLSGSKLYPVICPFIWMSWKFSDKWDEVDSLTARIVENAEHILGVAQGPTSPISAKVIGADQGDPNSWKSIKEKYNSFWNPLGEDKVFANRLINVLRLRCLVACATAWRQGAEEHSVELTMAELLGLQDSKAGDFVLPSLFLQKLTIPSTLRLEFFEGRLPWEFKPEPGTIYVRKSTSGQSLDTSVANPEENGDNIQILLCLGTKASNSAAHEESNSKKKGSVSRDAKTPSQSSLPALFAFDTKGYKMFVNTVETIYTNVDSEPSLHRFVESGLFSYIVAPSHRMDFFPPRAIRQQIGHARSSKKHIFRTSSKLSDLALWETRWNWTSSLADQVFLLKPEHLIKLLGSSFQASEPCLRMPTLLDSRVAESSDGSLFLPLKPQKGKNRSKKKKGPKKTE